MKKILKQLVLFAVIISLFSSAISVTAAQKSNQNSNLLFTEDFESYNPGKAPYIKNSASYTVQSGSTGWAEGSADYIRVAEERVTKNKIADFFNSGTSAITANLDKSIGYSAEESIDFEVNYRIKPYDNSSYLYFEIRGDLDGATSAKFNMLSINDNSITFTTPCGSRNIGEFDTKKWTSIKVRTYVSKNLAEVYIDGVKRASQKLLVKNPLSLTRITLRFASKVSPRSHAYYDDISISELASNVQSDDKSIDFSRLNNYRNVHPRLLIDAEGFNRSKALAEGRFKNIYDALVEEVDTAIAEGAPEYYYVSNEGETWMTAVADHLMQMCYVYKISGDEKYKIAATNFFNTLASYPSWGRDKMENANLAASHCLVAISCYYDWLYHDLTPTERYNALNLLAERGTVMNKPGKWWARKPLSNHYQLGASSLAFVAAAVYDEYPEAENWFRTANNYYSLSFRYFPDDGGNLEGELYWAYATQFIVYYIDIAGKFLGMDFSNQPYITKTVNYGINMGTPRLGSNETGAIIGAFNFGDSTQTRSIGHVASTAYMANYTSDRVLQDYVLYFADNVSKGHRSEMWKTLLYYNDELEPLSFAENYPKTTHFDDIGYIVSRTGWDDNRSAIAIKCGPFAGHNAMKAFLEDNRDKTWSLGLDHTHPDINSFMLFAYGDRQIVDEGYSEVNYTSTQNTLTVNNFGQYSDDALPSAVNNIIDRTLANPKITLFKENDDYLYAVCDGTDAYVDSAGVEKFVRHFVYMKNDDLLLTIDDIKTANPDDNMELRYFTYVQKSVLNRDGSFTFDGENSVFTVKPFLDEGAKANADGQATYDMTERHGSELAVKNKMCVYLHKKSDSWVQPIAFSWSPKGETPVYVSSQSAPESRVKVFNTDKMRITVDIDKNEVELDDYADSTVIKVDDLISNVCEKYTDISVMDASDIAKYISVESEIADSGRTVLLKNENTSVKITADSDVLTVNGNEHKMLEPAVYRDGKLMVDIPSILKHFSAHAIIDEENSVVNIYTGVMLDNSELYTLSVNGVKPKLREGTDNHYEAYIYGSELDIHAVALERFANVEIIKADDLFGTSYINITSPDGTSKKQVIVTTLANRGMGKMNIYNITYSGCDGNYGEYVLDGDLGTRWSQQGTSEWIKIDLGSVKELDSISIAFQSGSTRRTFFDIQYSADDKEYSTYKSCESSGTSEDFENFNLDGIKARYIMLHCKGNSKNTWNSIKELYITEKGGEVQ